MAVKAKPFDPAAILDGDEALNADGTEIDGPRVARALGLRISVAPDMQGQNEA